MWVRLPPTLTYYYKKVVDSLFNWLKNLFSKSDSNSVEQESHNYFLLSYDTNLCGVSESHVLKTTDSLIHVIDIWCEHANSDAMDYVDVDEMEDLEVFTRIEEISEDEYKRLKEEELYSDWVY